MAVEQGDEGATVEQRCARIRGRMVWILSQLEGDGTALAELADAKVNSIKSDLMMNSVGAEHEEARQEAHEREMNLQLERPAVPPPIPSPNRVDAGCGETVPNECV